MAFVSDYGLSDNAGMQLQGMSMHCTCIHGLLQVAADMCGLVMQD